MKRWGVLLCVLFLMLAGCGGGGGGGGGDDDGSTDALAVPEYDLAGCWEVNEQPECEGNIVPDAGLGTLEVDYRESFDASLGELETEYVSAGPTRIRQTGNVLNLTDTDTGRQISGTIVGDVVRYDDTEDISGVAGTAEAEGTALSADGFYGAVVCELRSERIVGAPASCIEAGEPIP